MKKTILILCSIIACVSSLHAQSATKTENVVIVTFDGLRWQELFTGADSALIRHSQYVSDTAALYKRFWADTPEKRRQTLMPFFWTVLARQGQLYGNRRHQNYVNLTNRMWFSYPGYNEILCGFADDARITSNDKVNNPNVTLLEFLNKQPAFRQKVAVFGSWDVFPYIINTERSGVPVNAGYMTATGKDLSTKEVFLNELQPQVPVLWSSVRMDAFTHQYAMEHLQKHHPRVTYIAYGETDDFAHEGKYDAYLQSAYQTDQFIKNLWEWLQADPAYKNKTTLLITTDHGRGTMPLDTWRSHGEKIPGADQVWLAAIGPDTPSQGEMKQAAQVYSNQIAKTVAALLNVTYTAEKKTGNVISSVIKK